MSRTPAPMPVFNTCRDLLVVADIGYDTLVVNDLGDTVSMTQVAEDGRAHNIVLSLAQIEAVLGHLHRIIS